MKPSISFAITTHNEFIQLKKSIDVIESFKDDSDELLFLDDFSDNDKTLKLLENRNTFKRKFEKDYSDHKNYLNSLCSCDYILQLDGDEVLSQKLITNIKSIIQDNADTDLFYIPRANYVQGINKSYLKRWNWKMDNKKRINYPDFQGRLFKNKKELYWHRSVHERITGNKNFSKLPLDNDLDIIHEKHIQKQIANNNFYSENYNRDCTRK